MLGRIHASRQRDRLGVALLRQPIDMDSARVTKSENFRDFIKSLACGIVSRPPTKCTTQMISHDKGEYARR